jgi:hypothetical protein
MLRRPRPHRRTSKRAPLEVEAPQVLSFVLNPEASISFFDQIKTMAAKRRVVFVDLSNTTTITPDAITGLLMSIQAPSAQVMGNQPADPAAAEMINTSGFRDYVKNHPAYVPMPTRGQVRKGARGREAFEERFNQGVANKLTSHAVSQLSGPPPATGPSYRMLCEAMLNTFTHASPVGETNESWWASVYYDAAGGRACFTFIDQGVGIFNSQHFSVRTTILHWLTALSRGDILGRLFQGDIPSSTRLPGRGNGIPGMYEHCKAGRIHNLTVLTNNALGEAETETYRTLTNSFGGTLIYWEIHK